jgi:hypothetical protein
VVEFGYNLVDFLGELAEILSCFAEECLEFREVFSGRNLLTNFLLRCIVLFEVF